MVRSALLFLAACAASAEVHTLTLRQAIDTALKQNPDMILARLDEQRAALAVRLARDPFTLRLYAGSGLAYSSGLPQSVEGSAPSIFQARAVQSLYNRPRSFEVAQARENARTAAIDATARREEIAHRTAMLYLDAERVTRTLELAREHVSSVAKVAATVDTRVTEGRELPIEGRRAALQVAQARQRVAGLEGDLDHVEASLAVVLGFPAEDRVRPAASPATLVPATSDETAGIAAALANNSDIKRLESALQAKGFELKGAQAARYPQIDLLAQYALLGRFNNYEDFFRRFQRHNGQIGVSITLPILPGGGAAARAGTAELEIARLRAQISAARDRVALEARHAHQELRTAESAREVAKLDLDVAREWTGVLLAQLEEGRASLRQVEEARARETEKWLAFTDAGHAVERARLNVLRQTGTLLSSLP